MLRMWRALWRTDSIHLWVSWSLGTRSFASPLTSSFIDASCDVENTITEAIKTTIAPKPRMSRVPTVRFESFIVFLSCKPETL